MAELDEAMARLEQAIARLEAASQRAGRNAEGERVDAAIAAIAERIDAALAKLELLLEREE